MLAITAYLLVYDRALLERRSKVGATAEQEPAQQQIQRVANLSFLALFIVPGLDHRWNWSRVPTWLTLVADVLIVLGFLLVFAAFRANSYASGVIEVADDQRIIRTGPYATVRHPMYSGMLGVVICTPLALGSSVALGVSALMVGLISARLLDEERFLRLHLPAYAQYQRTTRYRLIPWVW